ncbi:alpha-L-rhamnosidase [Paenibacillaceae bacterium]|nr:alpha-L-rhamnosidase [Paenibacillaceae bacterium]
MSIQVIGLKTEYRSNPLGIDTAEPRLSWRLESTERNVKQTAYQIKVWTELGEDRQQEVWDSGEVESEDTIHIQYKGEPLQAEHVYHWKVRIWDQEGKQSAWSETAYWTMGLLSRGQWKGKWIGLRNGLQPTHEHTKPAIYLRKEFQIDRPVRRATVYATALGAYTLYLNGGRVSPDRFAPEWTDYHVRALYRAYDVTAMLQAGDNAVGSMLAPGWYAGFIGMFGFQKYGQDTCLLLQLNIEYADGTQESVVTDRSWKAGYGPITATDMQMGEHYDATKEIEGWNQAGFDDSTFAAADQLHDYRGWISAHPGPPIVELEQLDVVSVDERPDGAAIYDFGQNLGGWIQVQLQAARGDKVTFRFGEVLDGDGNLYTENLRHARQTDVYIAKGGGLETFETEFTFHGFRYVEVRTDAPALQIGNMVAKVAYSATETTGSIVTSDALVNRLAANVFWTQRGNSVSVPTDCPQRDERHGWTGDAQVFFRTATYNMDVASFFTKWIGDLRDSQRTNGAFPDFAPFIAGAKSDHNNDFTFTHLASAGWGDAGVIIPWTMYLVYGDTEMLATHYDAMARWVAFLENMFPEGIRNDLPQYGDWLSVPHHVMGEEAPDYNGYTGLMSTTPYDVFATAYYAYSVQLLGNAAQVLGRSSDAERYREQFAHVKAAFREAFVSGDVRIKGNTQTAYVMALHIGLLEEEERERAFQYLVEDIEKRDGHITTGIHGIKYLLPILCDYGREDLAFRLLNQESYPSWKYSVKQGATTIWERWDGWTEEHGFQKPGMNSFNHYALGSVGEWLYRYLGGIELDASATAFKRIVLQPRVGGGMSFVDCKYQSIHGDIQSHWKLEGGRLSYTVHIPANCTATVYVPANPGSEVAQFETSALVSPSASASEGGGDEAAPVRRLAALPADTTPAGLPRQRDAAGIGQAVFRIGSGSYRFESELTVQD